MNETKQKLTEEKEKKRERKRERNNNLMCPQLKYHKPSKSV